MSANLRQACRADIPALMRIRQAVRENRLGSRTIPFDQVAWSIEHAGRGWVIENPNEVIAFAIADTHTGSIWALFVDPAHERQGHGRLLLDTAANWLWSRGLKRLWLTTEPGTRAQRFYEKAGWSCIGAQPSGELRFELARPA